MFTRTHSFILICLAVSLLSTTAVAQPRMFIVRLGDSPTLYPSGPTVIAADPGDQVCVGIYVQGGIDSRGVEASLEARDLTPNGSVSGTVEADCSTIAMDTGRPDYIGFDIEAPGPLDLCTGPPYYARVVGFNLGSESSPLPAAPDGGYLGEVCYDVSLDACGEFDFAYVGAPNISTGIVDEFGELILNAIFDGLVISVDNVDAHQANDDCNGATAVNSGTGAPVVVDYALTCVTDSSLAASCDVSNDVWFRVDCECLGELDIVRTSGTANIAVYAGSCNTGDNSELVCGDSFQLGDCADPQNNEPVTPGQRKFVRVGGSPGDVGQLTVTCTPCCTPNVPAGDPITASECGPPDNPADDICQMWYCNRFTNVGALGCMAVTMEPGKPGNNTDTTVCGDATVCTQDRCVDSMCTNTPSLYGDVDANGAIGLADVFCVLDGFAADFSQCTFAQDDIHGTCGVGQPPCCPNGSLGILDLFAVLNAFAGEDPCCGP